MTMSNQSKVENLLQSELEKQKATEAKEKEEAEKQKTENFF